MSASDSQLSPYPRPAAASRTPELGATRCMPNTLPAELWRMIISSYPAEDRCWAWFVLRRVSFHLREITEDVFATHIIRDMSIRISGHYARDVLKEANPRALISCELPSPSWLFKAVHFFPADTKEKVVLKHSDDWVRQYAEDSPLLKWHRWVIRQICSCVEPTVSPRDGICTCYASIFFGQGPNLRLRLAQNTQLVKLNGQLKSIRLPSVTMDTQQSSISVDWRLLCQSFYYQELKSLRIETPQCGPCKETSWMYWDVPRDTFMQQINFMGGIGLHTCSDCYKEEPRNSAPYRRKGFRPKRRRN